VLLARGRWSIQDHIQVSELLNRMRRDIKATVPGDLFDTSADPLGPTLEEQRRTLKLESYRNETNGPELDIAFRDDSGLEWLPGGSEPFQASQCTALHTFPRKSGGALPSMPNPGVSYLEDFVVRRVVPLPRGRAAPG
jgi:hypothetical protein